MRSPDLYLGALLTLLGAYVAYEGWDLGLGQLHEPGSGFILVWVGIVLALLGAGIAVLAPFAVATGPVPGVPFAEVRWRKLVVTMLVLVAYAAALDPVGFIPATFILLLLLFRVVDPLPWTGAVLGAAATTGIVYVVFGLGLGTQFPMGLLADR